MASLVYEREIGDGDPYGDGNTGPPFNKIMSKTKTAFPRLIGFSLAFLVAEKSAFVQRTLLYIAFLQLNKLFLNILF